MAFFRSEVVGGKAVKQRLQALKARVTNLRPFWEDVFAPQYFAGVQDVFALEGQRRGDYGKFSGRGIWEPLTARYAAWKERHYPGRRILDRTGALRTSLQWRGHGLGPGGIWQVTATSVTFGTTLPYAKYHQFGTRRMVARPFLDPPDKRALAPQLKTWIAQATKK